MGSASNPLSTLPPGFEVEEEKAESQSSALPPGFEIETSPSTAAAPRAPVQNPSRFSAVHPALAGLPQPTEAVQQAELNAQSVAQMLTSVGQRMRQQAIPHELRGYTPEELAQPGGFQNPRTGVAPTVGADLARVPILDSPVEGGKQIIAGVEQAAEPDLANKAGGASKIIRGGMQMAEPALPGALAGATIPTVLGLAGGAVAQDSVQGSLKKAGVPEPYADLAGDVAGLAGGGLTAHLAEGSGRISAFPPERATLDRQIEAPETKAPAGETKAPIPEPPPGFEVTNEVVPETVATAAPPPGFEIETPAQPESKAVNDKLTSPSNEGAKPGNTVNPKVSTSGPSTEGEALNTNRLGATNDNRNTVPIPWAQQPQEQAPEEEARAGQPNGAAREVNGGGKEQTGQIQTTPKAPLKPLRPYEEVQKDIDNRETELASNGVDTGKLYDEQRNNFKALGVEPLPGWRPMPEDLADLYRERDRIQQNNDEQFNDGLNERLKQSVPDDSLRSKLVQEISESDKPAALRAAFNPGHSIYDVGRIANHVVDYVAKNVTHEPEDHWEKVDAVLGGTPDNPSVQLRRKGGPAGYQPYGDETYRRAQAILDALLEANSPKYPMREAVSPSPKPARSTNHISEAKPLAPRPAKTEPAYGSETAVRVPGEQTTYPARYAVREAEDVHPSHNAFNFERNPQYDFENDRDYTQPENASRVIQNGHAGTYDPAFTTSESPTAEHGAPVIDQRGNALGGNSRTMTQQRVYEHNPQGATAYREALSHKAASLGVNPADLGRFKKPMLVRELTNPITKDVGQKAITDFNKTAAAKLAPEEQAVADGRRLGSKTVAAISNNLADVGEGSTLAQALSGDKGADIVQALIKDGVITPQEKNAYVDEHGSLTGAAKDRIAKALVGRMFESSTDFGRTPTEMRNKLERVAPQVLRVEDRPEWSLTAPVREAVTALADAKAHGIKQLGDLNKQMGLNGKLRAYSPDAIAIAKKLQEGPLKAQQAFRQYANDSELSREDAQVGFFEPPTRHEAFEGAFGNGSPVRDEKAQHAFASRSLKAVTPSRDANSLLRQMDSMFIAGAKPGAGRLYLNRSAMAFLSQGIADSQGVTSAGNEQGFTVSSNIANKVLAVIERTAKNPAIPMELGPVLHRLGIELHKAVHDAPYLVAVPAGQGMKLSEVKQVIRHELIHRAQFGLTGNPGEEVNAWHLLAHPAAQKASEALVPVYGYSMKLLAAEIPAWLGAGQYEQLGLNRGEAISALTHYFSLVKERHGAKALSVLAQVKPDIRKEIYGRWIRSNTGNVSAAPPTGSGESFAARDARVNGPGKSRSGEGPGDITRLPQRNGETGEQLLQGWKRGAESEVRRTISRGRSLFDEDEAKRVADSAASDNAKVEGERLTVQLKAPLSREEQLKKLKPSMAASRTDLFTDQQEPLQGALFSLSKLPDVGRYIKNAPTAFHGARARTAQIKLTGADAQRAVAHAGNRSAIETLSRLSESYPADFSGRIGAMHLSPNEAESMRQKLVELLDRFESKPRTLLALERNLAQSVKDRKSFIMANAEAADKELALREELDHALQSSVQPEPDLKDHLGSSADVFLAPGALGRHAANVLRRDFGYRFKWSGKAAAEIGVRLTAPGRYKELGINPAQARELGDQYLQLLEKEYGSEKVAELRQRIEAARDTDPLDLSRRSGDANTGRPENVDRFRVGSQQHGKSEPGSAVSKPEPEFSLTRSPEPGDEGKVNYSGLGALQDKFVRNLSQLNKASPVAHEAAIRAASSKSQASVVLKTAAPAIERALGKDHTYEDFRRTLIESRLQGLRQRWEGMADFAKRASDDNLSKSMERLLPLLEHLQDRAGFPRKLSDTAVSLAEKKDFDSLRALLRDTFKGAAGNVARMMPPAEFDAMRYSPSFQDALKVYKKLVEKPMAESHALNEGIFSDAKGPLDTYYPLVPVAAEDQARVRTASKQEYSRPKNIANNFATGLAEDYDAGMEALRDRLTRAVKSNNKAALMDTLVEEGLVKPLSPFEHAGDVIEYAGQQYQAVKMETTPARVVIQNGKATHLPPSAVLVPRWLHKELEPVLQNKYHPPPGLPGKIINALNAVSLSGPADFIFHSSNLFGALVANTPFLGTSLLNKAASVPVLKRFTAIVKVLSTDPTTDESAADLQQMAKLGILPDRFGSETFSKKYAEQTGAQLKRFSAGPMLFGPKGIDIRARLVMFRLAKEILYGDRTTELSESQRSGATHIRTSIGPSSDAIRIHQFVNQLGNYVDALQGELERAAKHAGIGPFATAGTTMLRNGINAWTGAGPMPKSGVGLRLWQQLTGGGIGLVALWAVAQKQYTGKWPWEDKRSKLLQIPANPEDRHSKLGKMLWGKGAETGYINMSFFNPLAGRGARALGITGATNTAILGGKWWQQLEAAQKDSMNSFAHPFLGPVPRAAFVGLTGDEPYLTGLRDDRGRLAPQLEPGVQKAGGGVSFAKKAAAAARELNSFYGNVGAAVGGLETNPHDTSNKWARMAVDLAAPGLVGFAQNPAVQRAKVARQVAAVRRQR